MNNLAVLSISGHESAVTLLIDGKLHSITLEERLSGIKYDNQLFHVFKVIKDFHDKYGLAHIILINGTDEDFGYMKECLKKYKLDHISVDDDGGKEHHLYHAASGFYASGFDEAIVLVIDGWGADFRVDKVAEMADIHLSDDEKELASQFDETMFLETTSVYKASYPGLFESAFKYLLVPAPQPKGFCEIKFPIDFFEMLWNTPSVQANSAYDVGVMYGTITRYLGWDGDLECGKTMGLAAYGEEDPELPPFTLDNQLCANMNLFYSNRIINATNYPEMRHFDSFQKKANIAYKMQKTMEKVLVRRIEQILETAPDTKNIVFSGGCALNICANSIMQKKFPQINFFIDPIAGDACQSYGAAKYHYHNHTKSMKKDPLTTVYKGLPADNKDLLKKKIEIAVAKSNMKLQPKQN